MKTILLLLLAYFVLFAAFNFLLPDFYFKTGSPCQSPIDARAWHNKGPADAEYVTFAADHCYNVRGYFMSFFPADLLFIVVYTWLFFALRALLTRRWLMGLLGASILIGALMDLGEDFSFAVYLLWRQPPLASATAAFTTVKTVFFILNHLWAIVVLLFIWLPRILRKGRSILP
jgi:hypothetical protein